MLSEKFFLNETKNHNPPPPPFMLNGRSLNLLKRQTSYKTWKTINFLFIYYVPILIIALLFGISVGKLIQKRLNQIQERAPRFIYEDYSASYDEFLNKSKLPSLKVRRMRSLAIEVYIVINKECPVYLQDLIHIKNNSYSFRYQHIAELPQVRTTSYGLQSFGYAGTKLWNELPAEFRTQSSLNQIKTLISSWSGSSCQCFACKTS